MTNYDKNTKINVSHLERKAIVYVRQSSEKQVKHNVESKQLQYDLVNKAGELGWKEIEVIDADLGSSAALGACERPGFDRLMSLVAKGEVGLVISSEVSRLSRTDKDWCCLLEICQIFDRLLGDSQQIYDLSVLDDQLILGIKGTMSVVELKTLQIRMLAALEKKARRGELYASIAVGYVLDPMGKMVKDPDVRIQEAIGLIFQKFREFWSIRQAFLWFAEEGIQLPVNKYPNGEKRIEWQIPTFSFIKDVLKNAFYAGAYVWGRRETQKVMENGKIKKRIVENKPEQCKVFKPNHHQGYIDWKTFKENTQIIENNRFKSENGDSLGPVRSGQALLSGLLQCGHCGRKLRVRYSGKSGTFARYDCHGNPQERGDHCLGFGGKKVDDRFSREILKVLSPLGIRASLMAIEQLDSRNSEKHEALQKQIEQIKYEAMRAFEQYNAVDPRNRLVAAELERRWNKKLEQLEELQSSLSITNQEESVLSEKSRKRILQLGENFREV
ncbi:recombinase family protein, partial [Candidatus Babeliales bacterium]|nr:recombinase family protein [Candidatus Babeliales bacterium]